MVADQCQTYKLYVHVHSTQKVLKGGTVEPPLKETQNKGNPE